MFFKGSRYAKVETAELTTREGRVIRYKKVRLIPSTPAVARHVVKRGDRLDLVAHTYFRDPERFWRICDANAAVRPDDLLAEPGREILVPASAGG